jgi:FtsP/CotA-like multicopper oxidase with cupredoxin domain
VIVPPAGAKWLALDIISAAGVATLAFSIDEHPMWVYAVDAHYIEPLKVDALTVANGDRYSIFVQLDYHCHPFL